MPSKTYIGPYQSLTIGQFANKFKDEAMEETVDVDPG